MKTRHEIIFSDSSDMKQLPEESVDLLEVDDLTAAEVQTRRRLSRIVTFFQRYVPGFESAKLLLTERSAQK